MANKYLDHGLYAAYSATPTFGVCQDGDGLAAGAATAATVSIDLTAYTAAAGALFAIGGATLTCVASGAAGNQFNAGAGSTLAANLATAINQTTNTQVIVTTGAGNPMLGWLTTTKVQDVLYATSSGATLQIQTRCGSALFNSTASFAAISTGLTGGSQISQQFTGGASGAWGYVFNHLATIWRSALAIGAYGVLGANKPLIGSIDPGDRIKCRSNKTLTLITNTVVSVTAAAMGSATDPVIFEIDDGTLVTATWNSEGTNPVFKITQALTGNSGFTLSFNALCYLHIVGKQYSTGQRSIVLESTGSGAGVSTTTLSLGTQPVRIDCMDLYCPAGGTTTCRVGWGGTGAAPGIWSVMYNCRLVWPAQNNNTFFVHNLGSNVSVHMAFRNCEFMQVSPTSAQLPVIQPFNGASPVRIEFEECKFTGFVTGSKLCTTTTFPSGGSVIFRNCDYGNIAWRGPVLGAISSANIPIDAIYGFSIKGSCDFFQDTRSGFVEWNSSKGYPTATARLDDGTTPWVFYGVTTTVAGQVSRLCPFDMPAMYKKNTIATGNRTATVSLALESTLTFTKRDISVTFNYLDSTGKMVSVDTYDIAAGALTSDVANISQWSTNNGTAVTFGAQTFTPLKFSATLTDCALNCVVTAVVRLHTAVANDTLGVFVDPEMAVT